LWPRVKETVGAQLAEVKMGDPRDFENFVCAVIDRSAFKDITGYIEHAKSAPGAEILFGGGYSDEKGYFIEPTVILASDPKFKTMCEEIFGPVLTVHVYPDGQWSETLDLVDSTSPYALTGAVFSRDRAATREAMATLRCAAGNFYINDKPTGAVVGQQPFGGARASGTNDKAGSFMNLVRWVSPRSVKETFVPATDFKYPYMKTGVGDSMEDLGHKLGEQMGEIREHLGVLGGSLRDRFGSVVEKAKSDEPDAEGDEVTPEA